MSAEMMSIRERMRIKEKEYKDKLLKERDTKEVLFDKRERFEVAFLRATEERLRSRNKKLKGILFTKTNRPPKDLFLEVNSGQKLVDDTGFIPISEQVRRFEVAGRNLQNEMAKLYDFSLPSDNYGFDQQTVDQYPDKLGLAQAAKEAIQAVKDYQNTLKESKEEDISNDSDTDTNERSAENVKSNPKDEEVSEEKSDSKSDGEQTADVVKVPKS